MKQQRLRSIAIAFILALFSGCGRSGGGHTGTESGAVFQTRFQHETEYIEESIVSDLAEMICYAKDARLPDQSAFRVAVTETNNASDEPLYDFRISLKPKSSELRTVLKLTGPIWSPENYQSLAQQMATAVGFSAPAKPESPESSALLERLTDGLATTIERENQRLSENLRKNFTDPVLHQQAAVLLGALALREHSRHFYDVRPLLNRMTAHLVFAGLLNGTAGLSTNGQVAQAMLLTLMNNQADALAKLNALDTRDHAIEIWVRVLKARNTADYRPLEGLSRPTLLERIAWFDAFSISGNGELAWSKAKPDETEHPDFCRIAQEQGFSVETGHEILDLSLKLEVSEIGAIYALSQGATLKSAALVAALNQMPEHCIYKGRKQPTQVNVIGWGQWAAFLQRHLCQCLEGDFNMLEKKWAVHEDSAEFASRSAKSFGALRLYPFVKRLDCTDVKSYHEAVDEALEVAVKTPQVVSAGCWTYFFSHPGDNSLYLPSPGKSLLGWFSYTPLPGTAYEAGTRLERPFFFAPSQMMEVLTNAYDLAPYDPEVIGYLFREKYHGKPTHDEALALCSNIVAYSGHGMGIVSSTLQDQPAEYEEMLLKLAKFNPHAYARLGDYFQGRRQDDKAAEYYELDAANNLDAIEVASHAGWMVKYYLKKGRADEARKAADFAAEVYSFAGLEAKAEFHELVGEYAKALEWYSKIDERYDDPGPVIGFCLRYKAKTGGTKFDTALNEHLVKIFPQGTQKVNLSELKEPPKKGVLVDGENALTQQAGLKMGDIIVAAYGVKVSNMRQYMYARELSSDPELVLLVFQDGNYREIRSSPPGHRFGVDFVDYPR